MASDSRSPRPKTPKMRGSIARQAPEKEDPEEEAAPGEAPEEEAAPGASSTPSDRPLLQLVGRTGKERRAERSAARSKAKSTRVPIPLCHAPPTYRAGQSVLWFWAPWFATAALNEAPETLKGRGRPKWFTAVITALAEARTVVYAGQIHNCQTYDVY